MKEISNEEWNRAIEEFENLPEKAQRAIYWVIKNWDFVVEMCKESDMSYEEIEKYKMKADEKGDYALFVLLRMLELYKNGEM